MSTLKRVSLWVMAAAYFIAGLFHFINPENFLKIMPPWLPAHLALVLISGAAESILGLLLLFERTRRWAAYGIILLLIAVFPANYYMWQTTVVQGPEAYGFTANQLFWRMPFQLVLILWAYWHSRPDHRGPYPV